MRVTASLSAENGNHPGVKAEKERNWVIDNTRHRVVALRVRGPGRRHGTTQRLTTKTLILAGVIALLCVAIVIKAAMPIFESDGAGIGHRKAERLD